MSANFIPTFNGYNSVNTLRVWTQRVLPYTYDDSLSYLENLYKIIDRLNDLIINNDSTVHNIESLKEAFSSLQNYVNNYFDSEDFKSDISDKLDSMAADGTLTDLLSQLEAALIGRIETVEGAISELENNDNNLATQITSLGVKQANETCVHYQNTQSSIISGNLLEYHDWRTPGAGKIINYTYGDHDGTLSDPYESLDQAMQLSCNVLSADGRFNITQGGYYAINRKLFNNASLHVFSTATAPVYLVLTIAADVEVNTYEAHVNINGGDNGIVILYRDVANGDFTKQGHAALYFEGGTVHMTNVDFRTCAEFFGTTGRLINCKARQLIAGQGARLHINGGTYGGGGYMTDNARAPIIAQTNAQICLETYNGVSPTWLGKSTPYTRLIEVSNATLIQRAFPTYAAGIANEGIYGHYAIVISTATALSDAANMGSGNSWEYCLSPNSLV